VATLQLNEWHALLCGHLATQRMAHAPAWPLYNPTNHMGSYVHLVCKSTLEIALWSTPMRALSYALLKSPLMQSDDDVLMIACASHAQS
jgi:hypothetical protein